MTSDDVIITGAPVAARALPVATGGGIEPARGAA